jgi:hypothetical protein
MHYGMVSRKKHNYDGLLLTQQMVAEKFVENNLSFPDGWEPYLRRKGDFFYDGGVPIPQLNKTSNNYFDELKFYMKEYEDSLRYFFSFYLFTSISDLKH